MTISLLHPLLSFLFFIIHCEFGHFLGTEYVTVHHNRSVRLSYFTDMILVLQKKSHWQAASFVHALAVPEINSYIKGKTKQRSPITEEGASWFTETVGSRIQHRIISSLDIASWLMLSAVKRYLSTITALQSSLAVLWYPGNSWAQWGPGYYGHIRTWEKYSFLIL